MNIKIIKALVMIMGILIILGIIALVAGFWMKSKQLAQKVESVPIASEAKSVPPQNNAATNPIITSITVVPFPPR